MGDDLLPVQERLLVHAPQVQGDHRLLLAIAVVVPDPVPTGSVRQARRQLRHAVVHHRRAGRQDAQKHLPLHGPDASVRRPRNHKLHDLLQGLAHEQHHVHHDEAVLKQVKMVRKQMEKQLVRTSTIMPKGMKMREQRLTKMMAFIFGCFLLTYMPGAVIKLVSYSEHSV